MGGFLDKTGLTTPQVTTNKILLEGDNLKDLLANAGSDNLPLLSSRYDNAGLETYAWKLADGTWLDGRIYTESFNKIREMYQNGDTNVIMMEPPPKLPTTLTDNPDKFIFSNIEQCFRLPLYVAGDRILIKEATTFYDDQNGYSYRIYSDGWCELNIKKLTSDGGDNFEFYPIEFESDCYFTQVSVEGNDTCIAYVGDTQSYSCYVGIDSNNPDFDYVVHLSVSGIIANLPPREEWQISYKYYFKVANGLQGDLEKFNPHEKLLQFESDARQLLTDTIEEVVKDYVVYTDKQVGELYFSFNNYYPDGVIPLDGRLVSRATYADLWQWVQEKGLVKPDSTITTDDENSVSIFNEDGTVRYCPWYGSGDGQLTFRVPKINGYLGATGDNTLAGQHIAEGLPNITGSIGGLGHYGTINGAFFATNGLGYGGGTGGSTQAAIDASRSNPIYGNSEHVTPETNTLFVGVWALTAAKAGVFDMRDIEETLKASESYLMNNVPLMSSRWDRDGLGNLGWVKADGSWLDGRTYTSAYNYCVEHLQSGDSKFIVGQVSAITQENYDKFIVDTLNKRFRLPLSNCQRTLVKEWKDGYNYYRIYSDGFCEQGGGFGANVGGSTSVVVNFFVPFLDTNYHLFAQGNWSTHESSSCKFTTKTTSSATITYANNLYTIQPSIWVASGYVSVPILSDYNCNTYLYFKLAHEFYAPSQADLQEKVDMIDNLVTKVDIDLPTLSSRWDSPFAENIGWVKSEGNWLNGNTYRDAYDMMVSRIGVSDKFVAATVGTELTDENADKFLIDTAAVRFRLPLVSGERTLVQEYYQNGTYGHSSYQVYSDGYCVQNYDFCPGAGNGVLTLLKPYKNTKYNTTLGGSSATNNTDSGGFETCHAISGEGVRTNTSIRLTLNTSGTGIVYVRTEGFANVPPVSDYNCNTYLYFKLADQVPSTVVDTQVVVDDLKSECDAFKQECQSTLESSVGKFIGFPDYTSGVIRSVNLKYTSTVDGFLYVYAWRNSTGSGNLTLKLGTTTFPIYSTDYGRVYILFPVAKGTYFSYTASDLTEYRVTFYPVKGYVETSTGTGSGGVGSDN